MHRELRFVGYVIHDHALQVGKLGDHFFILRVIQGQQFPAFDLGDLGIQTEVAIQTAD